MPTFRNHPIIVTVAACLLLCGCNLPAKTPPPDLGVTSAASTLGALQTSAALTQTAPPPAAPATPSPSNTPTLQPAATGTPIAGKNPLVRTDSLCWVGPGDQYEVVSAIRSGKEVELLGRGTIPSWYIVRNPVYKDPCWIPANNLEIPSSTDVSVFPYFTPPPTPTLTPTVVSTP